MQTPPRIVERPAQPYVAIVEDVVMPFQPVIDRVMPEIGRWMKSRGVAASGPPFFKFEHVKMPELRVGFGFPTATPMAGDARVVSRMLPAGRYVSMTHHGHYDDLEDVTATLIGWAGEQGLRWDARDVPGGQEFAARLEIYHTDPRREPDPQKWETELLFKLAGE